MSNRLPIFPQSIEDHFRIYAAADDPESNNGRMICFRNVWQWLMETDVTGMTSEDGKMVIGFSEVKYAFKRVAQKQERIDCEQFCDMLDILERRVRVASQEIVARLTRPRPSQSVSQLFERQLYDR